MFHIYITIHLLYYIYGNIFEEELLRHTKLLWQKFRHFDKFLVDKVFLFSYISYKYEYMYVCTSLIM